MLTFQTRITTLDKILFEGEAVHCRISLRTGSLGLEARHEPFLAELRPGSSVELRLDDGRTKTFPVVEGMLRFRDNRCTIMIAQDA